MILAHGIGGRTDLPVPVWMVGYAAAAALLVSFAALAVFWRSPRLETAGLGPIVAGRTPVARVAALGLRALGVAMFVLVLTAALFGDSTSLENIAPVTVYVIFWVGLTIVCGLFGDLYSLLDPYETLGAGLDPLDENRPYRLGMWPAAAGLLAFVWLELVHPNPAEPRIVAVALLLYTAAILAGSAVYGRGFLRLGQAFRAWFGLLGAMAPLAADGRGHVRWRWPLAGLAAVPGYPGLVALVCVALGSTAFDGVTRSSWWTAWSDDVTGFANLALGTAGLAGCILVVAGAYLAAMWVADRLTGGAGGGPMALARAFVPSLVPIAFAYAVAHYVSLLVFEGQTFFRLLSDPFGLGWDVFGTADVPVDFTVLSVTTVSWVQVVSIVVGHVAGVIVAHDRALVLFPGRDATKSQYPLLVVMVAFTVCGLLLLLGG